MSRDDLVRIAVGRIAWVAAGCLVMVLVYGARRELGFVFSLALGIAVPILAGLAGESRVRDALGDTLRRLVADRVLCARCRERLDRDTPDPPA